MSFFKSEVLLLTIPFTNLTSRKVRPAVVIGRSSHPGDFFVIPIISQFMNVDQPLRDWRAAGLNVPCGMKPTFRCIPQDDLFFAAYHICALRRRS
jgi:hypothetical protein